MMHKFLIIFKSILIGTKLKTAIKIIKIIVNNKEFLLMKISHNKHIIINTLNKLLTISYLKRRTFNYFLF
jgi:hypothetical protein